MRAWIASLPQELRDDYQMVECLQYPGEVIFVPNGWHHAVFNIDINDLNANNQDSNKDEAVKRVEARMNNTRIGNIAITQNWMSINNAVEIYKTMSGRRRNLARRLFDRLSLFYPHVAEKIDREVKNDPLNVDFLYEPHNDPKMPKRRTTRYLSKTCLEKATKEALVLLETALPDVDQRRQKDPTFNDKAITLLLQGNEDSSDSDDSDYESDEDVCFCGEDCRENDNDDGTMSQ